MQLNSASLRGIKLLERHTYRSPLVVEIINGNLDVLGLEIIEIEPRKRMGSAAGIDGIVGLKPHRVGGYGPHFIIGKRNRINRSVRGGIKR